MTARDIDTLVWHVLLQSHCGWSSVDYLQPLSAMEQTTRYQSNHRK